MKRIKRIFTVILSLLIMAVFSGCSLLSPSSESLLSAPELTDSLAPVLSALKEAVTGNYTLKYPTSGEYRSAIVLSDLDADSQNEAIVFYSISSDSAITMHVNIIAFRNGKWQSVADAAATAGNVEKVQFYDMDGDGIKELLVGWSVYAQVEKQLVVYKYTGTSMSRLLMETYTDFTVCDLENNYENNLLTVQIDTTGAAPSFARYYSFGEPNVKELGSCIIDGGVTAVKKTAPTKLTDGTKAVLVDAFKGGGTVTQIIYYKDGMLCNPLYTGEGTSANISYRQGEILSEDIDGNGLYEIPVPEDLYLPEGYLQSEAAALTKWALYDGEKLIPAAYTLMNYTDGYRINVTENFRREYTVIRKTEDRIRIFYDCRDATNPTEIYRIRTVTVTDYDSGDYTNIGYEKLGEKGKRVYLIKITEYGKQNGFTPETVSKDFVMIGEH